MLDHGGEWLVAVDARRKHIADPVAWDQRTALVLGLSLDSAVVNLELLVLVQIVPHCHLVGAADCNPPHFHGRHPAQVKMCNHPGGKVHRDIGNVWQMRVEVTVPSGFKLNWLLVEQIVDNGKIMWGKIPEYVHVRLEQPEIDAHGIEIRDDAKRAAVPELAQFLHR